MTGRGETSGTVVVVGASSMSASTAATPHGSDDDEDVGTGQLWGHHHHRQQVQQQVTSCDFFIFIHISFPLFLYISPSVSHFPYLSQFLSFTYFYVSFRQHTWWKFSLSLSLCLLFHCYWLLLLFDRLVTLVWMVGLVLHCHLNHHPVVNARTVSAHRTLICRQRHGTRPHHPTPAPWVDWGQP